MRYAEDLAMWLHTREQEELDGVRPEDDTPPSLRDTIATLTRDLAEARAELEAAAATFDDEEAAHAETLRDLAEARRQLEEAGSIIERLYSHVANERAGVPTGTVLDAAAWLAAALPSKPPTE